MPLRHRYGAGDNGKAPEWLAKLREDRKKKTLIVKDMKTATPFYVDRAERQEKDVKDTIYNEFYVPKAAGFPKAHYSPHLYSPTLFPQLILVLQW